VCHAALKDGLQRITPNGRQHVADLAALGAKFTKKQEKVAARAGVNVRNLLHAALPTINRCVWVC
jgi:hypothetical protein